MSIYIYIYTRKIGRRRAGMIRKRDKIPLADADLQSPSTVIAGYTCLVENARLRVYIGKAGNETLHYPR